MAKHHPTNRKEAEKEQKEMFGFVPKFYSSVPDATYHEHWMLQRDLELSDQTALDNKTKELIGLAVAAQIKCQYCIYFHSRAAQTFGATDQEMREAIAIAGLTDLFSNSLNGVQYDYDNFKREVERVLENMK